MGKRPPRFSKWLLKLFHIDSEWLRWVLPNFEYYFFGNHEFCCFFVQKILTFYDKISNTPLHAFIVTSSCSVADKVLKLWSGRPYVRIPQQLFFFIFHLENILRSNFYLYTSKGRLTDLKSFLGLLLVSFIWVGEKNSLK